MHSALFVAVIPVDRWQQDAWKAFVGQTEAQLKPYQGIERLAENVWLLDLTASVTPLGFLIAGAEGLGIAYRTLPFDAEPQWLPGGQNPTPTQGRSG